MKRLLRQRLRRNTIVTLKDGQAFSGVLFDVDAESIILRNSTSVGDQGERVVVDGELLLLRPDVSFIQLL